MLILGQHGMVGEIRSEVDLSYLSDAILLFRYFEAEGRAAQGGVGRQEPTYRARVEHSPVSAWRQRDHCRRAAARISRAS